MAKYNFFDLQRKKLPDDVNAPVYDMLQNNLKCPEAVKLLKDLESTGACGGIQIFDLKNPKQVQIKTNYGMVEGYDLIKVYRDHDHVVTQTRHIKNVNLSMKKPSTFKKGNDNG